MIWFSMRAGYKRDQGINNSLIWKNCQQIILKKVPLWYLWLVDLDILCLVNLLRFVPGDSWPLNEPAFGSRHIFDQIQASGLNELIRPEELMLGPQLGGRSGGFYPPVGWWFRGFPYSFWERGNLFFLFKGLVGFF